jgi:hypothetical protein
MKPDLIEVIHGFNFNGEFNSVEPLECGNINDTYIVVCKGGSESVFRYILQKINHNVFKEPENLMKNVIAVTGHIRKKVIDQCGDSSRETLNFISVRDGGFVYKCSCGNYWRAYSYIDGVKTYQIVEDPLHFHNAGRAFGKFQRLLSDFPAEELYETIPDFHNTPKRYKTFLKAVEEDAAGRVKEVKQEIMFVKKRARFLSLLANFIERGDIPLRVTHNDTKFNNVLIDDKTGEGICVIDLDTVMPGSSLYDFGDSIRSGANTAGEEELDLSRVTMDLGLFDQFTRGFLEYTHDFLTPHEIEYLPFSANLITIELGMRFLTDYINGDVYFKTSRPDQNLHRARVQFKLVEDMEAKYNKMKAIVDKYNLANVPSANSFATTSVIV